MMLLEDIERILSRNIKELRERRGWSQAYLAERMGMDPQVVYLAEKAHRWPRLDTVVAFARALEVPQATLFAMTAAEVNALAPTVSELRRALSTLASLTDDQIVRFLTLMEAEIAKKPEKSD